MAESTSIKKVPTAFVNVFTTATTTTNHLKTHHHFLATSDLKSFGSKDSTAITHQNLR